MTTFQPCLSADLALCVITSAIPSRDTGAPKKGPASLAKAETAGHDDATERKPKKPMLRHVQETILRNNSRLVFAALCDWANTNYRSWRPEAEAHDGFASWISRKTMGEMANISLRTVDAALEELQTANIIRCIYHGQGGDPQDTCVYLLTPHLVKPSFLRPPKKNAGRRKPVQPLHGFEEKLGRWGPVQPLQGTRATVAGDPCNESIQTRATVAPEVEILGTNHHHQRERQRERPDDDERGADQPQIADDPEAEFFARLTSDSSLSNI